MKNMTKSQAEPIAIIGTSCRFPGGSDSPSKLWELLKHPVDVLNDVPTSRFNTTGFYNEHAEHSGKAYLLEKDPLTFDHNFFGISAKEAESMDPQQRIALETVYEAIESAGYSISKLRGSSTSVFVGQMTDDYRYVITRDLDCHPQHAGTGLSRSIVANRISYAFDWRGLSVNIDTACSSSLVGVHQAVQSLRSAESELAVVVGVNLVFGPDMFSFLSSLHMISSTGRSRMWDINADGYARGEGFAAVILKPLSKALADGDAIESVIRGTGVNQDGRSTGLTAPSAAAHAQLIKSTYTKCGLDCYLPQDRCQYFEAHGTGTPVGDPKEAEGINAAFFSNLENSQMERLESAKIYVGSIKTVIGHSEGTAGLASLLKASKAVHHGLIPPNLHFDQLNPAIEPYYQHLEVPTGLTPWPQLPAGAPRRASVNSFGFGGTNAHAIIESWEYLSSTSISQGSSPPIWGPFVLSADTKTALTTMMSTLSEAIKRQKSIDLARLAWTLQMRRSVLTHRASFVASNKEQLIDQLDIAAEEKKHLTFIMKSAKVPKLRILGVFTGQGAQWTTMGASLYLRSAHYRNTIQKLEASLVGIPLAPSWSMAEELLRQDNPARMQSPEISQPLCTAVQLALVDLLRECGIVFSAVVGHSSGEIAAAYAAGILNATDAMLIAYYRGYHSHRIPPPYGTLGKMMSVGMATKDAEDFCQQPHYRGRICVAAKNSGSSITLSGDADAINEAKAALDAKSVFCRILKVDKAYHSHHMDPIRDTYLKSLQNSKIRPLRNFFGGTCNWYSSVYGPESINMSAHVSFADSYWIENLTNPVLFQSALTLAVQEEHFDLALEIGPHPALKGPATESIQHVQSHSLPYHGLLERGKDAVETFSRALGFVWKNFESPVSPVDFSGFLKACNGREWTAPQVQQGLPPYPWDHDRPMISESRRTKQWRTRNTPFHELLGRPDYNESRREVRWRNILRLNDVEWLQGHQFQHQVLLPAAGYLTMAVDAALHLNGDLKPIKLVELQDVVIHNGIILEEGSSGVEITFTIRLLEDNDMLKLAEFSCHSSNASAASAAFDKQVLTGRVLIETGIPSKDTLPGRMPFHLPMTNVDTDRFYLWIQKIGLDHSEPFLLDTIQRRLHVATVTTIRKESNRESIHSGTLDSILHGLYAAFSYPGDGRLWTAYLPKSVGRARFSMHRPKQTRDTAGSKLVADIRLSEATAEFMSGDIDVFSADNWYPEIQLQDVVFSSLEVPSKANDRLMFWQTKWNKEILSPEWTHLQAASENQINLHELCERMAYFYLRQIPMTATKDISKKQSRYHFFIEWAMRIKFHPEWENDDFESMTELIKKQPVVHHNLVAIHHLGPQLPFILSESVLISEVLEHENMLEKLYTDGAGFSEANNHFGEILERLIHQYPRMRVLEIGVGKGEFTSVALRHFAGRFENYTVTDSSPLAIRAAESRFATYKNSLRYEVFDVERPPVEQGFESNSYDLVIAPNVLHTTGALSHIVRNCREMLRPGGHIVALEMTSTRKLHMPLLSLLFPGMWQRPICTESQWDAILKDNGFSGIDQTLPDFEEDSMQAFSVFVSQAVDDRVNLLRDPLNSSSGVSIRKNLLIIGGLTLTISKLAASIHLLLVPFFGKIRVIKALEDLTEETFTNGTDVVCLSGLEESTFTHMNRQRLSVMQLLFRAGRYILWTTKGCLSEDPYASIAVGLARTASREMAHLRLKLVDVDRIRTRRPRWEATIFSEMMLQMIYFDTEAGGDILWSNETEVAIADGAVLIPRVVPDHDANRNFNSTRRRITVDISPSSHPIEIGPRHSSKLLRLNPFTRLNDEKQQAPIQVLATSLFQFTCLDTRSPGFYIWLGYSEDMNQRILGISETSSSIVTTVPKYSFVWKSDTNPEVALSALLTALLCRSLVSNSKGTIWAHNADEYTSKLIMEAANHEKASIFLTTSSNPSQQIALNSETIHIHSLLPERELRNLVPQDINRFVNLGESESDRLADFSRVFSNGAVDVQPQMQRMKMSQTVPLISSMSNLVQTLQRYCDYPELLVFNPNPLQNTIIPADKLFEQPEIGPASAVVSWNKLQSIQVQLVPAVSSRLFQRDKTYFLVGLASNLGLSLCEWMTSHGARYFALASRSPNVAPEVIAQFKEKGAVIRVFALDISNTENLKKVHDDMCSSMPPIAGVANAALVVRDHPFDGMSLEDLEAVFRPKVVGSQNLDQLFYSTKLDFFILFGSGATVMGNPGQSGYNAANLFMSALADRRRKRGFAASIIHFGMLLGLGFIHEQARPNIEARFRQDDLLAITETDFHAIFAQAVLVGDPEAGMTSEVISGIGTEREAPWRTIPRFSHCQIKDEAESGREQPNQLSKGTHNMKDWLKSSHDGEESLRILKAGIAERMAMALGRPGMTLDEHVGLISLGFDSLIAVEMRSWLLKILEVDVPVLKLLGGLSLSDLCHDVLRKLELSSMLQKSTTNGNDKSNPETMIDLKSNDSSQETPTSSKMSNAVNHRPMKRERSGRCMPDISGEPEECFLSATQNLPSNKEDLSSNAPMTYEKTGDMSHAQAQLYFLHEYLQNNEHNVAYSGRFHGELNIKLLEQALWVVGKRHEALRSAYFLDKSTNEFLQAVLLKPSIVLEHGTICGEGDVQAMIDAVKDYTFDIESGVIMKVTVLTMSPSLHYITFNHHHIALDGFSWRIFMNDLARTYSGSPKSLAAAFGLQQSMDMAKRQREALTPQHLDPVLTYWKSVYQTIPQPLPLFPFAKVTSRPMMKDFIIDTSFVDLPSELAGRVEMAASNIGITAFHFHLATLATFLASCLHIDDIAIGIVDANRKEAQDMETIGYFLNMLPVRISLKQTETFEKIAKRSSQAALIAMTQSYAPLDMVISSLGVSPSTDHHPLFQAGIQYRRGSPNSTDFGSDSKIQWDTIVPGGHPYDLLLDISATPEVTRISLGTQRSLYEKSDGALLLNWYMRMLENLAVNPSFEISRYPFFNDTDVADALEIGRGRQMEVSWESTITDRIDTVAAQFPDGIAIKDDHGQALSYAQMTTRTSQVRRTICRFPNGSHAATLLDPAVDAVCSILAVLQPGFVWIPLDTRNHHQRLHAIVKESRPQVLICQHATMCLAQQIAAGIGDTVIINIDDLPPPDIVNNSDDGELRSNRSRNSDPAMIIYTSGSTGVPKGVVLTQEGLVNQIYGTIATLDLGREVTLQHSPMGFDLMLDQIFLALCNGGTVVIASNSERGDPTELAKLMVRHQVTLTHFVPSEYIGLLNYGHSILKGSTSWRYAMSGGEKLSKKLRKAFHKLGRSDLNIVNVYGPAEITLACARGIIPNGELNDLHGSSSINDHLRPSPNYNLEIRDPDMNILPIGFPGEICISGPGVGLGYLHRQEESSRKFVEYNDTAGSTGRLYRSGDKGRLLRDGTLQVLGRLDGDSQVKIHGFRVELDEIANAIVHTSEGAVVNAAASLRVNKASEQLVAFVVFDVDFTGDRTIFLSRLQTKLPLPAMMKPTFITPIDRIPTTVNGKTDRRAVDELLITERTGRSSMSTALHRLSPWEESVKEVWEEVFSTHELNAIEPDSDFFDVGGTSILMIKLKSFLKLRFGITFSIPSLFHASTLRAMADLISDATKNELEPSLLSPKAKFLGRKGNERGIDWDLEIASLIDGLGQPRSSQELSKKTGLTILLSGATGFIGRHLLCELIKDPRVAQVHCISIRPDANGKARQVATRSPKVVEYVGDLAELSLGLSDAQFASLTEDVDVIIHNGADVSLLKTYQSLRRANVVSTRTLCEMAIPRRVPVHFVSTASVAKVVRCQPLLEVSASTAQQVDYELLNNVDGYAASKWASEALLERVAEDSGLPVHVHRLAHVVGEDASELDAVGMLIKYSLLLHSFPQIPIEDVCGEWDFIPVQETIRTIVAASVISATLSGSRQPIFINHCNDQKVHHDRFQAVLESMAGRPLQQIGMKEWLVKAESQGLHRLVREFFAAFYKNRGKLDLPLIVKGV